MVVSHLIPHFFTKEPITPITDPTFLAAIDQVKHTSSLEEAIKTALNILSSKYRSMRFQTYLRFFRWFETNPNTLWQRRGYLHCTQLNYLFRILLVKSGWVRDEDITLGYSLVWYVSPHQFLKVRTPEKTIAVDPWHYNLNHRIGVYARGFGMVTLR